MDINEITVPVPWGHVSAKVWGDINDIPVLVFHGVLDNAGSFDRLIPHLPESFCYICFDLPGHGKSSYFPPFLPIFTVNYIMVYQTIVEHLKKEKYIIMGHSYGAQIAFLYAQLYPEHVEKLIMLDTVHLIPRPSRQLINSLRDQLTYTYQTSSRPTYTYEEALKKLQDSRHVGSINTEAAERLLQRAVTLDANGRYTFTADPRLKKFLNPIYNFAYILKIIKMYPVTCPVLVLLARGNTFHYNYMKPVIDLLKKQKNIIVKVVEGGHDVHNNSPEIVSPHVCNFLLGGQAKL